MYSVWLYFYHGFYGRTPGALLLIAQGNLGSGGAWCNHSRLALGANIADRGIFTPASLFNDLGFTLTPDSMVSFQRAVLPLLLGSFLIIVGNTGFPCMLRFIIWISSVLAPRNSGVWEELKFLLDHPRRCFTLLFPNKATWWLFWILVFLNGLDLIFFIVLDVGVQLFSPRVAPN
jgi:Trk-type K+ transport system membrane component